MLWLAPAGEHHARVILRGALLPNLLRNQIFTAYLEQQMNKYPTFAQSFVQQALLGSAGTFSSIQLFLRM
jgi:hypothetical protein